MPKKQSKQNGKRKFTNHITRIERNFRPAADNNRIYKQRLIATGSISTSAIGTINTVLTMNPSGTSEWTQLSALYDEFRIVGTRVSLVPKQQYSVTAMNNLAGVAFDNDDTVTLTSLTSALEYDTAQSFQTIWQGTVYSEENRTALLRFSWARPTAGSNTAIIWCDVASPATSLGSVKFYAFGTNSTLYWDYLIELFAEFRGRR